MRYVYLYIICDGGVVEVTQDGEIRHLKQLQNGTRESRESYTVTVHYICIPCFTVGGLLLKLKKIKTVFSNIDDHFLVYVQARVVDQLNERVLISLNKNLEHAKSTHVELLKAASLRFF